MKAATFVIFLSSKDDAVAALLFCLIERGIRSFYDALGCIDGIAERRSD